ncbi:MAG: hypothetical protein ACHREM_08725 [Polyangiales bacterium]
MSNSGFAEPDCVFVTPGSGSDSVWYVTRHEPADHFVEMLKVTPDETACRLSIRLLEATDAPNTCVADVTYTHTSLGPQGDLFVMAFTTDYYRRFMEDWEREINHYLTTGEKLS